LWKTTGLDPWLRHHVATGAAATPRSEALRAIPRGDGPNTRLP